MQVLGYAEDERGSPAEVPHGDGRSLRPYLAPGAFEASGGLEVPQSRFSLPCSVVEAESPEGQVMVDRHELEDVIRWFNERLDKMAVAVQADVDALTTQINADSNELAALKTAVAALVAAQPAGLDLTALQAAVGTLDTNVKGVAAELPAAP